MKKFVAILLLSAPIFAMADGQPKVIQASITTVGYLAEAQSNTLIPGQAWEGEKVVQLANGDCQKITHSDLRIEKAGNAQKPVFTESKVSVHCPA